VGRNQSLDDDAAPCYNCNEEWKRSKHRGGLAINTLCRSRIPLLAVGRQFQLARYRCAAILCNGWTAKPASHHRQT